MKNSSADLQLTGKRAFQEAVLLVIISVLVYVLAAAFDLHEKFDKWTDRFEESLIQLDEFSILFAVLMLFFGIFSLRRWRELRAEIVKRQQLEERLKKHKENIREVVIKTLIDKRKTAEEELIKAEGEYRSVVDNIDIGVSLISPKMEILTLNRQMKKWFPHIAILKKPICYRSFNNPPRESICSYCPTHKTLEDGQVHESITEISARDKIINYRIVSSPIKDKHGKVIAAIEMVEDVTASRDIKNLKKGIVR